MRFPSFPRPNNENSPTPHSEAAKNASSPFPESRKTRPPEEPPLATLGGDTARRVIEILKRRKQEGYQGKFEDREVVAIYVGPGAMRASQSAAILAKIVELGLHPYVDFWIGSSAGAHNVSYAATGKAEAAFLGYARALAAKRTFQERFINPLRWFLRMGPAANLKLIRKIYEPGGEIPFDWPELLRLAREGRLAYLLTNKYGDPVVASHFESQEELFVTLGASSYIPGLYDEKVGKVEPPLWRGKPYFDGGIAGFLPVERIVQFLLKQVLRIRNLDNQTAAGNGSFITGQEGTPSLPQFNLLVIQGSGRDYLAPPKADTLGRRIFWRLSLLWQDIMMKLGHGSFELAKRYPGVAGKLEGMAFFWGKDAEKLKEALSAESFGEHYNLSWITPSGKEVPIEMHAGMLHLPSSFPGLGSLERNPQKIYNTMLEVLQRATDWLDEGEDTPHPPAVIVLEGDPETGEGAVIAFPYKGSAPWDIVPSVRPHEIESRKYPSLPPFEEALKPTPETLKKAKEWTRRAGLDHKTAAPLLEEMTQKAQEEARQIPPEAWEHWRTILEKQKEARERKGRWAQRARRWAATAMLWWLNKNPQLSTSSASSATSRQS